MNDARAIARAIVHAHAARFGGGAPAGAPVAIDTDADAVGAADADLAADPLCHGAFLACTALGFIAADARCLAHAWRAQVRRTGAFDAGRWPESPADFGLGRFPPASRDGAFAPCPERLGLYAVLPDAAWVERMAAAGVPTLQLRFKAHDAAVVAREVEAAVRAVRGTPALLFINDHWRAAIDAGAYGVHLGQEDLDATTPGQLEQIRSAGLRLGLSTHGYAEMVRADAVSPSYLAMGAVFATTLKRMATAPQGVARLAAYARLMRGYPQVAIGGIDAARLPSVLATGVGSVAVVRALVAADDPPGAAAWWIDAVAKGSSG